MKRHLIRFVCFINFFFIVALSPTLAQQLIERPVVRLIYFVPRDSAPQPNINADLDRMIKRIRRHYANEMERHGYARKTFNIETDANGKAVVHRLTGKLNDANYANDDDGDALFDQIQEEMRQRYNLSRNIYLVVAETAADFGGIGGHTGRLGAGGMALIPSFGSDLNFYVAAHEIGHTFGLQHDFSNDNYLLSYGGGIDLSACDAEWLDMHRAFNESSSAGNTHPTFEMLPPSSAALPNAIRLRFKVSDPDGLHQVYLLTKTLAGPAAGSWELHDCESVGGNSATVEFVTTRLSPKSKVVSITTIDANGNIGTSRAFPLDITQLLPQARAVSIPDANLARAIRKVIGNSITTHTLLNLQSLDASELGIIDLSGLEHARNLKELDLLGNAISDVSPLANLTHLNHLFLSGNGISDVSPLANLTHLNRLFLSDNGISDVSPLTRLTNLNSLLLPGNGISDVSPLANLTQLNHLLLSHNGISDVSPLTRLTNLNSLHLSDNNILDVSPLANLTNLNSLHLSDNNILDMSPLTRLTNLESLDLGNNNISDVSPLARLTNLESLDLGNNNISDVSPLARLTNLESLDLIRNNITDISPLANLTNLNSLLLWGNSVSDLSALTALTQLNRLLLSHNRISDVSPLATLTHLNSLHLVNNYITDISPLLGLSLSGTDWDSTGLYLRGNPLNRASVEKHIPALQARGVVVLFDPVKNLAPRAVGSVASQTLQLGGEPLVLDIASHFRDPEGNTLTYLAWSSQSSIVRVEHAGAQITITPVAKGATTVEVRVMDPDGLGAAQSISVTVKGRSKNRAPQVVGSVAAQTLRVGGEPLVLDMSGYFRDPDENPLTYRVSSNPSGIVRVERASAQITITPIRAGTATVVVRASDPDGLHVSQSISVTINERENRAPQVVGSVAAQTLQVGGEPLVLDMSGYFRDPDENPLTYRVSLNPAGIVRVKRTGAQITITPVAKGTATVVVRASDPDGLHVSQSISVTVNEPENRVPQVVGSVSSQTLRVGGEPLVLDMSGYFRDPEEDPLTYRVSLNPAGIVRVKRTGAQITLTPVAKGTATVVVRASDPNGLHVSQSISVTINEPENRAPQVAGSVAAQTLRVGGEPLVLDMSGYFRDPDENPLTYRVSLNPAGIVRVKRTGAQITITPVAKGTATVIVRASDPNGLHVSQSISVTVNEPENRVPQVVGSVSAQSLQLGGEPLVLDMSGYFRDPDENPLTYRVSLNPAGIVRVKRTGAQITITPVAKGTATVIVRASDPDGLHVSQSISVTINEPENRSPQVVGSVSAQSLQLGGEPLVLDMSGYFRDPDENPLTYRVSLNPAGIVRVKRTGAQITITPVAKGTATVIVRASDPNGLHVSQSISVTINEPENRSPQVVGSVSSQTLRVGGEPLVLDMSGYFRDPEEDPLTYRVSLNPAGIVRVKRAGAQITITPIRAGTATVVVRATDPSGLHVSQSISVTVKKQPAIQPPIAVSIPDASLAAAIRGEIGNSITTHTLLNLKSLDADNRKIRDLTGLEHAHNLESLDLVNNGIRDVSPLEKLTKLTKLELMVNPIRNLSPLGKLTQLNLLSLGGSTIRDISPLEKLTKLTKLSVLRSPISDVSPLKELAKLTWLELRANNISDVAPLAKLTKLNILALEANNISDVSPLEKLTNLESLVLRENDISDVSPLKTLTQLETLWLEANNISDVSPLKTLTLLERLVLNDNPLNRASVETHIPALQARGVVVLFDIPASIKILQEPPRNVSIPDVNLAAAIREEIGNSITTHTLLKLTWLYSADDGIRDLSGLEHAHNLESLSLRFNNISDISALAKLTNLEDLTLDSNDISDISVLAKLTNLEYLNLQGNDISDISALAKLTNLEYLYLGSNDISDISVLENLTKLEALSLRFNNISDISVLENLTKLEDLILGSNDISDISVLAKLTNLETLWLSDSNISDISALAKLTNLEDLTLDSNDISDISVLAKLTNLEDLTLDSNDISDISVLAKLTNLEYLNLQGNDISDISVLENLTNLEYLSLSDNNISDISPLLGLNLSGRGYSVIINGTRVDLNIRGNPLNRASLQTHIPALQARGVVVLFDKPAQAAPVLLPKETLLLTNYPNPFNPETWIPYQLAQPAEVTLHIYTPNGALVRALELGHQPAGNYQSKGRAAHWDGRNELGERVASGLYFYTLTAGEFTATRKMLIRK